jgi:hypothetical protein
MAISTIEIRQATACRVAVTDDSLTVDLNDGRTISAPLAWYPRLLHGSPAERRNWRFIGDGEGIHWPDLDEDISIENIVYGQSSGESQRSFRRWLDARLSSKGDSRR